MQYICKIVFLDMTPTRYYFIAEVEYDMERNPFFSQFLMLYVANAILLIKLLLLAFGILQRKIEININSSN